MNVVLNDDFNLSETESEYFSGTDESSDESFNEVSDSLYEGDTESNSFDQGSISGSSIYEQSIEDSVEDYLKELKGDSYDESENELEIFKEDGTDAEVMLQEFKNYLEGNDNEGRILLEKLSHLKKMNLCLSF